MIWGFGVPSTVRFEVVGLWNLCWSHAKLNSDLPTIQPPLQPSSLKLPYPPEPFKVAVP